LCPPGGSSKKKAIIGGVVGGAGGLILIILALFLWHQFYKKPKAVQKGILFTCMDNQILHELFFAFKTIKAPDSE
jgi:hypothetical protein